MPARTQLLKIYAAALEACHGERLVSEYLKRHPTTHSYYVIGIGKAAAAMLQGALNSLGERLSRGLLITKYDHAGPSLRAYPQIDIYESGHPLPDSNSLDAGKRLIEFLASAPEDARFLFLISGGASALVEFLPEQIGQDELVRVNDWLLSTGLDIAAMNRVRKSLSAIKGGRLAHYLRGRACLNLMISDVPYDDERVIGSGMLAYHTAADIACDAIALPPWIAALLQHTPRLLSENAFSAIESVILANNRTARQAAASAAHSLGLKVYADEVLFSGDALVLGRGFARKLREGERGCHIWGGESAVNLPPNPGRGGRNQAMALAAAQALAGYEGCCLLIAGTDGTDGPTEDAGALVDGETIARGRREGFDDRVSIDSADTGGFLEASGDLIQTGPTGTNVMDIVIGLKYA